MTVERPSTARGRELGEELRRVRRRAGLTGVSLAEDLEWSTAKISKLENGWRGTTGEDIAVFLGRCGADKATRDRVFRFVAEPDLGWFVRPHLDRSADELTCLAVHERSAVTMTCYEPLVVPSPVRTEAYAQALTGGDPGPRTGGQWEPPRTESVFYLHEVALSLPIGGSGVMREQMARLAFEGEATAVRVVPLSAGGHQALCHPSTVLTFRRGTSPLAYSRTDVATVFLDEDRAVEAFRVKHAVLDELALDVEASRELFVRWADVYGQGRR